MKDILVIDDEKAVRQIVWKALQEEGYTVHVAKDGKEGLQKIKEFSPGLVIIDYLLPDISGLELLKKIKKLLPKAAVMMLTGYMSEEEANKALKRGAFDFLRKPVDLKYLRKTVHAKMLTLL